MPQDPRVVSSDSVCEAKADYPGADSEAPIVDALTTPTLTIGGGELRAWSETDVDVLVSAWADPDIAMWNSVPREPTASTAGRWIAGVADRQTQLLSIDWVIDVPAAGGVVGEVGLSGFNPAHNGAMIGYWLLPVGRGKGLATAAVAAISEWAYATLGLDVIVARCHPNNPASEAVVARVGYVNERTDSIGHQLWISRTLRT